MRIKLENFTKAFGDTVVIDNMSLEIKSGEMLALLGPSGCGKSTTLFSICGIHRMNSGRLLFGETDVSTLPSQKRNVGVVFQNYALYPHMNAFENIAFPLKIRKERKADIERKVTDIAKLAHISELLNRKPAELSGGQQQRVALARALVREPDVLLLDEPLANLDAKLRLEMRSEIRRIQRQTGITAILVTHDQVEAMSMCDRIAIMDYGKIVQLSAPREMYDNPTTDFVAGFLGNPPIAFLEGTAKGQVFSMRGSKQTLPLPADQTTPADGTPIRIGIRPEHVRPAEDGGLNGRISFVETQGRETLYDITLDNGMVVRSIQNSSETFPLGMIGNWGVDAGKVLIFDKNGMRL